MHGTCAVHIPYIPYSGAHAMVLAGEILFLAVWQAVGGVQVTINSVNMMKWMAKLPSLFCSLFYFGLLFLKSVISLKVLLSLGCL